MKHWKKMSLGTIATVAMVACMSITAMAATADFTGNLPEKQGDTEISTVGRQDASVDHFTITISSLGSGTSSVRAWTEGSAGGNYSSPYNEASNGKTTNIKYYENDLPKQGKNVTLNLDNPVYMSTTVYVSGSWTPN